MEGLNSKNKIKILKADPLKGPKIQDEFVNLLAAGKFQYKSTSYKIQNLYIKSVDISGRVPELTADRYIDQPRRQRKVQCKKFVSFVMKV